jgi:hypothetical protein
MEDFLKAQYDNLLQTRLHALMARGAITREAILGSITRLKDDILGLFTDALNRQIQINEVLQGRMAQLNDREYRYRYDGIKERILSAVDGDIVKPADFYEPMGPIERGILKFKPLFHLYTGIYNDYLHKVDTPDKTTAKPKGSSAGGSKKPRGKRI